MITATRVLAIVTTVLRSLDVLLSTVATGSHGSVEIFGSRPCDVLLVLQLRVYGDVQDLRQDRNADDPFHGRE